MKEITILHVFPDEKFFDGFSNSYDKLSGVKNLYYLYAPDSGYKFRFITNTDKVRIVCNKKEYLSCFSDKNIDVVFFHSLRQKFLEYFKYIDRHKVVVWWSWGGDVYNTNTIYPDVESLIKWELYKPITNRIVCESQPLPELSRGVMYQLLRKAKKQYKKYCHNLEIKRCVSRVDCFLPCIPIDYKLLKQHCKFFHADEFPHLRRKVDRSFIYHEQVGNVLIGNSLTYTNNHLDIFDKIYSYQMGQNRKYIIPVSYGWGNAFGSDARNLISRCKLNPDLAVWLTDYMDKSDYFRLFNNMSHAVFGVLRQQALGNIFQCLYKGIKVFLYKDSVAAKQLKDDGYIFYTIDDDLTEESLSVCLSYEEAMHNYKVMERTNVDTSEIVRHKLEEMVLRKLSLK